MPKITCSNCPDLSPVISMQFTLQMCAAAKNCKENILKSFILKVQNYSRSSIDVDAAKMLVISAFHDKQHVLVPYSAQ